MTRVLILFVLGSMISLPACASRQLTVAQLRQLLSLEVAAAKSDNSIAGDVADVELNEQLTPLSLDRLRTDLKLGPKTMLSLQLLSDCSAFLKPSFAETQMLPPPDTKTQQALLNNASRFALTALRHLPDFLATRVTRSFESSGNFILSMEPRLENSDTYPRDSDRFTPHNTFIAAGTFDREISYRDGQELSGESASASSAKLAPSSDPLGLASSGEFGSELATILLDSAKGKIEWDRWEQTSTGVAAVFDYSVPQKAANYVVDYCCVRPAYPGAQLPKSVSILGLGQIANQYHGTPAYHGEIYLNPTTGALMRFTLVAEMNRKDPIVQVASSVVYGPVEIGGKTYTCPVNAIVLSSFRLVPVPNSGVQSVLRINDTTFTDYHRFGSTVRIVSLPAQ